MFRRDVVSLADIMAKYLRESGLETPLLQNRIVSSWEKVAGNTIARYTGEKFIKNQTLFVKIHNPALRANLTMMRSRLVQNLNAEVGSMVISDIKFF